MMNHTLRVALTRSITSRAHLLGAEAAMLTSAGHHDEAAATKRHYWRTLAAAATLQGEPWPEAEALG